MNQAVFFDANVHKCTKIGHVGYNAGQSHTNSYIVDCTDVFTEIQDLYLLSGVASRLFELLDDVALREIQVARFQ